MSTLLWALLIWFAPGLFAGVGLLALWSWEHWFRKNPPQLREAERQTGGEACSRHGMETAQMRLREEAQRCREGAAQLAERPEEAFMLRMATAFEQLDEEQRVLVMPDGHEHATAPHQRHQQLQ